jgi:hypothetical protein
MDGEDLRLTWAPACVEHSVVFDDQSIADADEGHEFQHAALEVMCARNEPNGNPIAARDHCVDVVPYIRKGGKKGRVRSANILLVARLAKV